MDDRALCAHLLPCQQRVHIVRKVSLLLLWTAAMRMCQSGKTQGRVWAQKHALPCLRRR